VNAQSSVSLDDQRRALREKIRAQRELIAEQLGPPPKADNGSYPRSRIMRFLTRSPAVAVSALAELAALVAGSRHATAASAVMALSRIVRSAAANGSGRPAAERTRV
jgi:hypothetical protein